MKRSFVIAGLLITLSALNNYAFASSAFIATTDLPEGSQGHALVASSGYLYRLGGLGDQSIYSADRVYYAKIEEEAKVGAWSTADPLPERVFFHAGAAHGDTIYILGGRTFKNNHIGISASVFYSHIGADGAPGAWQATSDLPSALYHISVAVSGDRIYVTGGWGIQGPSNSVYAADIQSDGSLSPWKSLLTLPESVYTHAAVEDGTLYVLGGVNKDYVVHNSVYYANILDDGSLDSWRVGTSLPVAVSGHTAAILDGRIYVMGGEDASGATDAVYTAPIMSDKNIGDWAAHASLPTPLRMHDSAATSDAIFIVGGSDGSAIQRAVYGMYLPKEEAETVATVDISPNTLNLASNGKHITLFLSFPAAAGKASDIDKATVRITEVNGEAIDALSPIDKHTKIQEPEEAGVERLKLKFDRQEVQDVLTAGDANALTIAAAFTDGTEFSGVGTIWANEEKREKHKKKKREKKTRKKSVFKVDISADVVFSLVSSKGGKIKTKIRTAVDIPSGATLGADITISPEDKKDLNRISRRLTAKLRKALKEVGPAVEYGPEGTHFSKPVTLEIPYDPAKIPAGHSVEDLRIYYWNPASGEWDALASSVHTTEGVVRAQTDHFSLYQVLSGGEPAAGNSGDSDFRFREVYAYPNPARRGVSPTFHIEAEKADRVDINIYDLSGERVHSLSIDGPGRLIDDGSGRGPVLAFERAWDVSNVGSGVYIFAVTAHKAGRGAIRIRHKVAVIK